jgi:hypothetical protein
MAILLVALLLPLAAILQSTLLWHGLPGGVTVNLSLLLTLFCGLRWGAAAGSASGLWAGALVGALQASTAGPLAVLYGVMGWLAGIHRERGGARWTYPLVALALVALTLVLEGQMSVLDGGTYPPFSWVWPTLIWHGLAGLAFLGVRR